ncbi:LysM peptidoglycan-binding domain-containing protein, partial [Ilumatobacter sp.]|uniref:LysM peptidoglycan-binding domain-containing protein n=1 Tax=Ilumatobacter sp. TaxID=1967498 RepID=UPI003AF48D0A
GPLLMAAGCGGTSATGAQATMARIQPTSFVELPPATTTTTTTISAEEIAASGISPVEQTYTIQRGDSISRIATIHDITMEQLVNYNSWSDGLNHFLVVGDPVKIPPGAKIPGSTSASAAPTDDTGGDDSSSEDESSGDGCTHTIVQGENPSRVASKYDITVDELRAANPGGVMDSFLIGATLQIPPNGSC